MVQTFVIRAILVLMGMIVVGFSSYFLLAELFSTKQDLPVATESLAEISYITGSVKNIYITPTTTIPARIEIETGEGLIHSVVIQPTDDCKTKDIFDVTQLTAGDSVEVRGSTSKRGDILPCDDPTHYLKVVKKREVAPVQELSEVEYGVPNAIVFSGTLQSFESACIHDGECYVVIDGRKVTILVGRSAESVGQLREVSLATLQEYIGKRFEVYALSLGDDSFTLYGNDTFYLRPL